MRNNIDAFHWSTGRIRIPRNVGHEEKFITHFDPHDCLVFGDIGLINYPKHEHP